MNIKSDNGQRVTETIADNLFPIVFCLLEFVAVWLLKYIPNDYKDKTTGRLFQINTYTFLAIQFHP